jgi:hypothetical protein
MRFCEKNVYKQCSPCNNFLSGNIILYRKALIAKFGVELVDYLESDHPAKKYSIEDIKDIKKRYTEKVKELS